MEANGKSQDHASTKVFAMNNTDTSNTHLHSNDSTTNYLNKLLHDANTMQASDVHIEPQHHQYRVRFRCNGQLIEVAIVPLELGIRMIARLKILANLDIAEKRLPQDGHFQMTNDKQFNIRLNTCPTLYGEKIALRLLDTTQQQLTIHSLGMTSAQEKLFRSHLAQPQGLILVCGPTGCGKTMTLYAALHALNTPERHIVTIEDPIEIILPGINQTAIHSKIGLNFTTLLRTLLRQDPDIMMIGEIRDTETAQTALQAAQTGHLVLATLHANDTNACLARLQALNVNIDQLAQALHLVVAQRLIRITCKHCLGRAHCSLCSRGYSGRTGIFELLDTRQNGSSPDDNPVHFFQPHVDKIADGLTLRRAAELKWQQGITDLHEIERVLGTIHDL